MTIFYLEVGDDIYAMDSTTSISRSSPASLSNSLVEDGNYSSDNYVIKPVTINFSGVITDIKLFNAERLVKSPKEYLNGLKKAQLDKTPIKVYYSDIQLPDDNCYFTSFNHRQEGDHGRVGELNSFQVDFTLQKVRFAQGARKVARPSAAVSSVISQKTKKNAATKELSETNNDLRVEGAKDVARGLQLQQQSKEGL